MNAEYTPGAKHAVATDSTRDMFPIAFDWVDPETGHRWIHLSMTAPFDYDEVKGTPRVLEYDGDTFVRTGWNSDKGTMYYRNHMPVAKKGA